MSAEKYYPVPQFFFVLVIATCLEKVNKQFQLFFSWLIYF
jgi:hypothetical protein